jgi:hypothetical protein
MTVRLTDDGAIMLEGDCPVEDAETLARFLLLDPSAAVDWRACDLAHTAVIQILLAARPTTRGPPRSAFLSDWAARPISSLKT